MKNQRKPKENQNKPKKNQKGAVRYQKNQKNQSVQVLSPVPPRGKMLKTLFFFSFFGTLQHFFCFLVFILVFLRFSLVFHWKSWFSLGFLWFSIEIAGFGMENLMISFILLRNMLKTEGGQENLFFCEIVRNMGAPRQRLLGNLYHHRAH